MNDRDYIQLWVMGFISLLGLALIFGILYSNSIVNAAYKLSDPIVKVLQ